MQSSQEPRGFAIIGDTQKTMGYQIFLGKEVNNHQERIKLFDHIKSRESDFLLLLGDMVAWGQSKNDWKYFDSIIKPLGSIPIFPVVGNHDYFFFKKKAQHELIKHFPLLKKHTWYSMKWGPLAVIVLDSNQNYVDQKIWLEVEIKKFESDSEVKGIILAAHHPPFTNSLEIRPHTPTREHFLPSLFKSKKTLAYFSGHCHAYERFIVENKTFIVSGGGGGPRQYLRTGSWQRTKDIFQGGRLRPFHYLWVSLRTDGLDIEVWGLHKHQTDLFLMEKFTLPWNV